MAITLKSLIPELRDEIGDNDEPNYTYQDPKLISIMANIPIKFNMGPITKEVKILGAGDDRYISPDFADPYIEESRRVFILLSTIAILNTEILNASRSAISKISPLGSFNLQNRPSELRREREEKIKELNKILAYMGIHEVIKNDSHINLISISDPIKAKFDNDVNENTMTQQEVDEMRRLGIIA